MLNVRRERCHGKNELSNDSLRLESALTPDPALPCHSKCLCYRQYESLGYPALKLPNVTMSSKSPPAHHVFISHAEEDRGIAAEIVAALEDASIACWIAPRNLRHGETWAEAIVRAIAGASRFVLLLSASSRASQYVEAEVERAKSMGIPVTLVRLEDIEPGPRLALFVGTTHWLDLFAIDRKLGLQSLLASFNDGLSTGYGGSESSEPGSEHKRKIKQLAILAGIGLLLIGAGTTWFLSPEVPSQQDMPSRLSGFHRALDSGELDKVRGFLSERSRAQGTDRSWSAQIAQVAALVEGAGPREASFSIPMPTALLAAPVTEAHWLGSARKANALFLCDVTTMAKTEAGWFVEGYQYWPSARPCLGEADMASARDSGVGFARRLAEQTLSRDDFLPLFNTFGSAPHPAEVVKSLGQMLSDWQPSSTEAAVPMGPGPQAIGTGPFAAVYFNVATSSLRGVLALSMQREEDGSWRLAGLPMFQPTPG